MREYFVYEMLHIETHIAALGGIVRFQQLKESGGSLGKFPYLFNSILFNSMCRQHT